MSRFLLQKEISLLTGNVCKKFQTGDVSPGDPGFKFVIARFSEASQITKWSLQLAKQIKKDSSKIQKTTYFFKLKTQVGEKKNKKNRLEKTNQFMAYNPCKYKAAG